MRDTFPRPNHTIVQTQRPGDASANYCALLGIPWSLNMGKAVMHARRI